MGQLETFSITEMYLLGFTVGLFSGYIPEVQGFDLTSFKTYVYSSKIFV